MSLSVKGQILVIGDEQQVTENFRKRDIIVKTDLYSQYPQEVKFQTTQDRCRLLDDFQSGQIVTVHFNLKGRGSQKNGETIYFTNLVAWKIESDEIAPTEPEPVTNEVAETETDNNLPF